ncbi:hypothetical protein LPJ66_005012 [Kickxella alabastrina]|uniref:Uncharacterized protein n=1 Tax=Kickxella alabastrina TaxID=61397 RepID=A0ACC1II30_9FUNG|nr:hypothetical protein LPJ66_005012 [Kickxella alabastrina]
MLVKTCILASIAATASVAAAASSGSPATSVTPTAAHADKSANAAHPNSNTSPSTQKKRDPSAEAHASAADSDNTPRVPRDAPSRPTKGRKRRTLRSSGLNSNDIDIEVKMTWCNDNTNFCNNVCLNKTWGAPINDGCDASNLKWHCTCGNGKNPDPDVYTFPVMHYRCQYEVYQCQNNCATGDIRCTQECQGDRNCTAPNDPNAGKSALPEADDREDDRPMGGLDKQDVGISDPINFFSAASSVISAGGYMALTALVASSLHMFGLP